MKMKKFLSIFLGAVIFCGTAMDAQAFLGGKDKQDKIVLGFLPNEAGGEWDNYRNGMAAEIEKATGAKVEVRTTDSYEALIDAMLAGELDLAYSGPNQYILAKDDQLGGDNIQPLVTYAKNRDLTKAGYPAWIATKKGSELHKEIKAAGIGDDLTAGGKDEKARVEKLKGKRFSFVSSSSSSGFKVPRAILHSVFGPQGTKDIANKDDFANPQKVNFMEITFSPTSDHQGNINAVYNQSVDTGAFCCGYFGQKGVDAKSIDDFYVIAYRTVPNEPIWANMEALGEDNAEKIKKHFAQLTIDNATETGKGMWTGEKTYMSGPTDGFVVVDDSFYDIIRQM